MLTYLHDLHNLRNEYNIILLSNSIYIMFNLFGLFDKGGKKTNPSSIKTVKYLPHKTYNKMKTSNTPIDTSKPVIGKVFAKWCGHCKTLMPIWDEMKNEIMNKFPNKYTFSEIEDTQKDVKFAAIKKNYNVDLKADGFPTLFKIQNGKVEYYNKAREKEAMQKWFLSGHNIRGGKQSKKLNNRTRKMQNK